MRLQYIPLALMRLWFPPIHSPQWFVHYFHRLWLPANVLKPQNISHMLQMLRISLMANTDVCLSVFPFPSRRLWGLWQVSRMAGSLRPPPPPPRVRWGRLHTLNTCSSSRIRSLFTEWFPGRAISFWTVPLSEEQISQLTNQEAGQIADRSIGCWLLSIHDLSPALSKMWGCAVTTQTYIWRQTFLNYRLPNK